MRVPNGDTHTMVHRIVDSYFKPGRLRVATIEALILTSVNQGAKPRSRCTVTECQWGHCQEADALDLPHKPSSFDLLVCINVLRGSNHKESCALCYKFRQLLRPGGFLLVIQPIAPMLAEIRLRTGTADQRPAALRRLLESEHFLTWAPKTFLVTETGVHPDLVSSVSAFRAGKHVAVLAQCEDFHLFAGV
jgi:methyltransferase family protein